MDRPSNILEDQLQEHVVVQGRENGNAAAKTRPSIDSCNKQRAKRWSAAPGLPYCGEQKSNAGVILNQIKKHGKFVLLFF